MHTPIPALKDTGNLQHKDINKQNLICGRQREKNVCRSRLLINELSQTDAAFPVSAHARTTEADVRVHTYPNKHCLALRTPSSLS